MGGNDQYVFKIIAEFSSDWLMWMTRTGKVKYVSPAVEEITGYNPSEFMENPDFLKQILYPDDLYILEEEFWSRIEQAAHHMVEFRIRHKDGSIRWIAHHCKPVFDDQGKIVGRISSNRDVTNQKVAQEILARNERFLRSIIDGIQDPMHVVDQEFKIVLANQKLLDLIQEKMEDIIGRHCYEIYQKRRTICEECAVKKAFETGRSCSLVKTLSIPGKDMRYFEVYAFPLRDEAGRTCQAIELTRDITEKKHAETALKQSEQRYRKLSQLYRLMADNIPDLVWAKDLEGKYIFVNKAVCEKLLMAKDTEEPLGKDDLFFAERQRRLHPDRDDWHTFGELCQNSDEIVLKSKKAQRFDEFGNVQGQFLYLDVYKAPIYNEEGHIIGTVGHGRIVTREKEIEKQLKESERRYRQIFEDSQDVIFVSTMDGRFEDINIAGLRLFGYDNLEEIKKINIEKDLFQNPNDRKIYEKVLKEHGHVKDYELFLKRKDGTNIVVRETSTAVIDKEGNVVSVHGIMRDVTVQKRYEREILRLATVVEQATQSIIITDSEGRIEYVNPAFEIQTGYSLEEIRGKTPGILKGSDLDEQAYRSLWESILSGRTWHGVFRNKIKDGSYRWVRAVIFPIKDSSGKITNFAAVEQDITKERILEQQLQQSRKMEALGTLAGGVAHDFNNVLTVINGYAEMILLQLAPENPIYEDVESILDAGKQAENLVRQLLAFSRKQIYRPQVLNINNVIKSIEKMLRRLIGENISIDTELRSDLPFIKADSSQLEQIFINLIVNARDALNESERRDKKIIIETGFLEIYEENSMHYPGCNPGPHVYFSVTDNGVGIDEQIQGKIFDPFFTTKRKFKGTGLGLSMVYGIVKQNNGTVLVESKPGEGTVITVVWPVTKDQPKTSSEPFQSSFKTKHAGNESILIVEDKENVSRLTRDALKSLGYQIWEAHDGLEALEIFRENPQQFDLIITDLVMPVMGGKELVGEVKKIRPDMKVIFVSGYSGDQIGIEQMLDKNVNFISKPYSIRALGMMVRKMLDEK